MKKSNDRITHFLLERDEYNEEKNGKNFGITYKDIEHDIIDIEDKVESD